MMFGGGQNRLLDQDARKARSVGNTLGRLGGYFARFWPMVLAAVVFVVVATWSQVTTPLLIGQATDCFLVPLGAAVIAALALVGIDLTALAVFSGVIGIGIGLGLQQTMANFVAGLSLVLGKTIQPGDVISVFERRF